MANESYKVEIGDLFQVKKEDTANQFKKTQVIFFNGKPNAIDLKKDDLIQVVSQYHDGARCSDMYEVLVLEQTLTGQLYIDDIIPEFFKKIKV